MNPVRYEVIYSGRVRDSFEDLANRARARDVGREALAALVEIEYRLAVYPQFGEPFRDLSIGSGVEWVGFVGPLTVRYVLLEDRREVWVVRPITLTRESGRPPG